MTDKVMQELQGRLNDVHRQINWWDANKDIYQPMLEELDNAGFTCSLSNNTVDVSGSGDKAKLLKLFRIMRNYGWEPTRRPEPKETWYSTFWRHQYVTSAIWTSYTGTECKRVQVGTKMEEVPVYEVQCSTGDLTVTDEEIKNG